MSAAEPLAIGDLAARTGLSVSAIRFYENKKLVTAFRNTGGHRRFARSDIRRLSFVQVAQQLGFTIAEIGDYLSTLPLSRTPTKADWSRVSHRMRKALDARILKMQRLRDNLDGCIGCGCLSMRKCHLLNPADRAGANGTGPRFLLGDSPNDQAG